MSILDEQYWNERHEKADTPWKIDVASPALTQYIDQIEDRTKSILIPGAGHYFEAAYLLEKGFTDMHSYVAFLMYPEIRRCEVEELNPDNLKYLAKEYSGQRKLAKNAGFAIKPFY